MHQAVPSVPLYLVMRVINSFAFALILKYELAYHTVKGKVGLGQRLPGRHLKGDVVLARAVGTRLRRVLETTGAASPPW